MPLDVAGATHVGRVRDNNEDAFATRDLGEGRWLLCVADGLGGLPAGEVASAEAVKTIADLGPRDFPGLCEAVDAAQAHLMRMMDEDHRLFKMSTTVVCAVVSETHLDHAWAGDSYLVVCRGGQVHYATRPQGIGHIVLSTLGADGRGLFRAPMEATESRIDLQDGDVIVLGSDGLTDLVPPEDIAPMVAEPATAQATAEALVQAALELGGHDNVTVVVARLQTTAP